MIFNFLISTNQTFLDCPGTQSLTAGKSSACEGCPNQKICTSAPKGPDPGELSLFCLQFFKYLLYIEQISENLAGIKNKILILSGKGGVGKSTVTTQLARVLARDEDLDVGVLDVDLCGPSVPRMLGIGDKKMHSSQLGLSPVFTGNPENGSDDGTVENISVVSIGFLLEDSKDAVIWRGNRKTGMLKLFLRDVCWDRCDFLLIDTPPGTSDEHLSLVQLCKPISGAILVTTPQEISWQDVRKEINFCRKVKLPILGIIVNMSEFVCPSCSKTSEIFPDDGSIDKWAKGEGIPILSRIPLDPRIGKCSDSGEAFFVNYADSPAAKAYIDLGNELRKIIESDTEF